MASIPQYSRNSPADLNTRPVAIVSVNTATRTAEGITRERSTIIVDISYPVGGMLITPAVGEWWFVSRVGMSRYVLQSRIPDYHPALNTEAVEGQVHVGSSGPLELSGSYVNLTTPLSMAVYTSATRPAADTVPVGSMVYDSDLGVMVFSDGAVWRDMAGAAVTTAGVSVPPFTATAALYVPTSAVTAPALDSDAGLLTPEVTVTVPVPVMSATAALIPPTVDTQGVYALAPPMTATAALAAPTPTVRVPVPAAAAATAAATTPTLYKSPPVFGRVANDDGGTGFSTSVTPASGDNYVLVFMSWYNYQGRALNLHTRSVTYGGAAMTSLGVASNTDESGEALFIEAFGYAYPGTGSHQVNGTVSCSQGGVYYTSGVVLTYSCVVSTGTVSTAHDIESSPSQAVTSTPSAGIRLANCFFMRSAIPAFTNYNKTERANFSGNQNATVAGDTEPTASTTTFTASALGGGATWVGIAVELKA